MKKIFTLMSLALVTMAMSAQVYVGGGVNMWRNTDNNKTTIGISPPLPTSQKVLSEESVSPFTFA